MITGPAGPGFRLGAKLGLRLSEDSICISDPYYIVHYHDIAQFLYNTMQYLTILSGMG